MASAKQVSGFLGATEQSVLEEVGTALQIQYEGFSLKRENIINPISELANYVYKAREAGLDKREQCSYSGSILVAATLEEMGQKYSSDVDKVNKVHLSGIKLANTIWSKLDALEESAAKVDRETFDEIIQRMSDTIWLHTITK